MILDEIKAQFGENVESAEMTGREARVRVRPTSIVALCRLCKERGYSYLSDVTAVDTGSEMRVVYRLGMVGAVESKGRGVAESEGRGLGEAPGEVRPTQVVISVPVSRSGGSVPSVTGVFQGANWPEREVYDMLGVLFQGHPDLRRILLTDDWQGYPMVKGS